jgi:hypothetical protein
MVSQAASWDMLVPRSPATVPIALIAGARLRAPRRGLWRNGRYRGTARQCAAVSWFLPPDSAGRSQGEQSRD